MKNILLIGAGSIGALKDNQFDSSSSEFALTHANAIKRNKKLNLIGIVDTDAKKTAESSVKWGTNGFLSIDDVISCCEDHIDGFVIATPTETHFDIFKEIFIKWNFLDSLKFIIIEKPFCETAKELQLIYLNIRRTFTPHIIVNYSRRFNPFYIRLKGMFDKKEIDLSKIKNLLLKGVYEFITKENEIKIKTGDCLQATVYYGRGLKRDGCHAIDLLHWFFGKCNLSTISKSFIQDNNIDDLSYRFDLKFDDCSNVSFVPLDSRKISIFEMDLFFENVRVRFLNNGDKVEIYKKEGSDYGKYDQYSKTPYISFCTELRNNLSYLYDIIARDKYWSLDIPGISDALEVHRVINKIDEEFLK